MTEGDARPAERIGGERKKRRGQNIGNSVKGCMKGRKFSAERLLADGIEEPRTSGWNGSCHATVC